MVTVMEKWADLYGQETGVYEMNLVGKTYVTVCTEDKAMELVKLRPYIAQRGSTIREAALSIGASGVFAAEQEEWIAEHKLVRSALNRLAVGDFLAIMIKTTDRLVQKWMEQCEVGNGNTTTVVKDIHVDLGNCTADAIAAVSIDQDFDFLNHPDSGVAMDMDTIMEGALKRALSPVWYWRIPCIGQYLDGIGFARDRIWSLVSQVVRNYERDSIKSTASSSPQKKTFLSKLFDMMHSDKVKLAHDRVIGNIVTLFLAGTDTTSKSLASAFYFISKDLKLQCNLRMEAETLDLTTATLEDFYSKLPRLKSFLHEIHRMYGVPWLFLQAAKEVTFCGTVLPKGTNFALLTKYPSTSKTSPSKDVPLGPKGEAPSEFCPERYLLHDEDTGKLSCSSPSTKGAGFMVFGQGMRSCPGRT